MQTDSIGQPAVKSAEDADLVERRTIRINGLISEENATAVIAKLLFLRSKDRVAPIHLIINSSGGAVVPGVALLEAMDETAAPIYTHCDGGAGGIAASLLAHGALGHRTASHSSIITLTQLRDLSGNADLAPDTRIQVQRIQQRLLDYFSKDTGQSESQLRADMNRETEFTAQAAKDYRLIDLILTDSLEVR
jgi:ATP-dependent Clp protease protease subunit